MASFVFLVLVSVIFAAVLFSESTEGATLKLSPQGLLGWISSDNWPAKVGSGLLLLGVGALLRYLMVNIDFPPLLKLSFGGVCAVILWGIAALIRHDSQKRSICLALGGAGFGVAYLTAYSAYGFFGYVNTVEGGLALLFLVAFLASFFAIATHAMSIAILAMTGAFIAPAFAQGNPGVVPVYGYLVAASILSLLMVWYRGWRPLIHLSFIFTLAGSLFFGWHHNFYAPVYFSALFPFFMVLVVVHVLMPLVERPTEPGQQTPLDQFYFLALPLVSAFLLWKIAPDLTKEGALGLALFGVIWLAASGLLYLRKQPRSLPYLGVGFLFVLAALVLVLPGLPMLLLVALASVLLFWMAPLLLPNNKDAYPVFGWVAFAFAGRQAMNSLFVFDAASVPFQNAPFGHNMLLVVGIGWAAVLCPRRGIKEHGLFWLLAGVLGVWTLIREGLGLHLAYLPQAIHLVLLALALLYAVFWSTREYFRFVIIVLLGVSLCLSGAFALKGMPDWALWPLLFMGQIVFSLIGYRAGKTGASAEQDAGAARSMLPIVILPWGVLLAEILKVPETSQYYVMLVLVVASALMATMQAQMSVSPKQYWPNVLSPVGIVLFGALLFYSTIFHIARGVWPVLSELLILLYLWVSITWLCRPGCRDSGFFGAGLVFAVAAVFQAMILRLFGPSGVVVMSFADAFQMQLPVLISFMWAAVGAGLCWWATRSQSRRLWSVGVVILAASAIKMVFIDFGHLGQLGNILAMIAAGVLFLAVAWLAPLPPERKEDKPSVPPRGQARVVLPSANELANFEDPDAGLLPGLHQRPWLWVVAIIFVIFLVWRNHMGAARSHGSALPRNAEVATQQRLPEAPAQQQMSSESSPPEMPRSIDILQIQGKVQPITQGDVDTWIQRYQNSSGQNGSPFLFEQEGEAVCGREASCYRVSQRIVLDSDIQSPLVLWVNDGVELPMVTADAPVVLLLDNPPRCLGSLCR